MDFVAIDPGSSKCGFAVFSDGKPLTRGIVAPEEIGAVAAEYSVSTWVVGDRTGADKMLNRLVRSGQFSHVQIWLIDENLSSAEGRRRFVIDNRGGWRRFWPVGLQSPSRPYDDYVAVILGERFLGNHYNRRIWKEIPH